MGFRRELVFRRNVDSQEVDINWVLLPHTVQHNHKGHLLAHGDGNVIFFLHRYKKPGRDEPKEGLSSELSGPLRCSWVLEQPHSDDRYDRGSIRNPQPWEWYPEVWQDSRTDISCPCSGNQILPYKFKLLLQWLEILEVIRLPENMSSAVGCPTWLLAVNLQVKVSWMFWVMSPITSGTLKVS